MPKIKTNDRAALLAQRQIHIPTKVGGEASYGDAEKVVWTYLQKFLADRLYVAEKIRDVIKDARADGVKTEELRVAMRLDNMTPEKREDWARVTAAAAKIFGYKGLETSGDDEDGSKILRGYVEVTKRLRDDRKEASELIRALGDAAKAAGVDFEAMKEAARIKKKNEKAEEKEDETAPDWMARIDGIGSYLEMW